MQTAIELAVGLAVILASIAAPFALGVAFHAIAAGTFGIGFIVGLGFFPAVACLFDRHG